MRAHEPLETTWAPEVETGLEVVLCLPEGWDGYDAKRIAEDAAFFALDLLDLILPDGAPAPAVVPTARGGVQLEWHEPKWQLEVEIISPDHVVVLGDSRPVGRLATIESEMRADFDQLRGWIDRALQSADIPTPGERAKPPNTAKKSSDRFKLRKLG